MLRFEVNACRERHERPRLVAVVEPANPEKALSARFRRKQSHDGFKKLRCPAIITLPHEILARLESLRGCGNHLSREIGLSIVLRLRFREPGRGACCIHGIPSYALPVSVRLDGVEDAPP